MRVCLVLILEIITGLPIFRCLRLSVTDATRGSDRHKQTGEGLVGGKSDPISGLLFFCLVNRER